MLKQSLALLLFLGVTAFIVRSASGCEDGGTKLPAADTIETAPAAALPQNAAREGQRPPIVDDVQPKPQPTHEAAAENRGKRGPEKPDPLLESLQKDPAFFSASKALSLPAIDVGTEPGVGGPGSDAKPHKGKKKLDPAFFSASKAAPTPVFRLEKEQPTPPPAVPTPPTQQAPHAEQAQQAQQAQSP